ncbi:MAG: hypothetical protein ACKVRP_06510 [Bacteroidota bacterium]
MLLIALTGSTGEGKTSALLQLAVWCRNAGKSVDGFVAIAGERKATNGAASHYDLQWLASGESMRFATRVESLKPPYKFAEDALLRVQQWAEGLAGHTPPFLVILDEFGPLEVEGGGHMVAWEPIRSAHPDVVVIAVRDGLEGAIEERLGTRFDIRVKANSPDAWQQLRTACLEHEDWSRVGVFGAASGGFEASVGSALHGGRVPMRGLFLSSMQSVVMTYAAHRLGQRGRVVWVPFISAGLKSLSPTGSRLGPMLAITMQGLLYGGAVTALGWNAIAVMVGGILVTGWAAAQGLVLQYLLFGGELLRAYDTVIRWVVERFNISPPGVVVLMTVWCALWGSVGAAVTFLAWRHRETIPTKLRVLLDRGSQNVRLNSASPTWRHATRGGLRDLARPFFWVPLLIVTAVIVLSGSPWESAFWIVARAATIGVVIFSLVRVFNPQKFIAWLRGRGHWGPALAFRRAIGEKQNPS